LTDRKPGLWVEWTLLFWVVPLLMLMAGKGFPIPMVMMLGTLGVTIYLVRSPRFDNRRFFARGDLKVFARGLLWKVPLVAVALLGLTLVLAREQLFYFPRQRPLIWVMVMLLYPVFSAFPQEIIYRAFFCMRYRDLFRDPRLMLLMNALCFAFVHVAYGNLVGPLLSLPGGVLFALTYRRHRSVLLAAIEHGLYGALVFTVGLGSYFYHRAMG